MKKLILFLSIFVLTNNSQAETTSEDKTLLSGKIEFTKNIEYREAIELAKTLSKIKGIQDLWVRKMGDKRYGVSLILKFDGSKSSKHDILFNFRKILGKSIQSWDLATGVTWIKKGIG